MRRGADRERQKADVFFIFLILIEILKGELCKGEGRIVGRP